jgi:ADP-dependent NAD(P)H-hydrate dehydratase / NAD(P)H-hydrate epimerase
MSSASALYSVAEIRDIESKALATLPPGTLMQRAGAAAAALAQSLVSVPNGDAILVLAGPGNNGGDALDCAARLAHAGLQVHVLHFAMEENLPADARDALRRAQAAPVSFAQTENWRALVGSTKWHLVIDGLFGIGLRRALDEQMSAVVVAVNELACPVLALDVPSGLDADTGNVVGNNGHAIRATHTLTFIADKPGLHTGSGRDHAGDVRVADLAIDPQLLPPANTFFSSLELFHANLRMRRHVSHKGNYGDALVIGGAHGMAGAAVLAARTAAKCGAGRVFAGFLDDVPAYDSIQPELMCRHAGDLDFNKGALVLGPGLGASDRARDLLQRALQSAAPAVIDADALNLIAAHPSLQAALVQRQQEAILTPHPLEAARLLGTSVTQVQADRLHSARELAKRLHAIVVLKGSGTVVSRPDGMAIVNSTGNPALATAGSGDVLAGLCGALLSQGWPQWEAAIAAVWLHGQAADELVQQGIGPIGIAAGELISQLRTALNRITNEHGR